jgi:hypothetical protein
VILDELPAAVGVDIGQVYAAQSTYSGPNTSCNPLTWMFIENSWEDPGNFFDSYIPTGQLGSYMYADAGTYSFSGPLAGMWNYACSPQYLYLVMWNMQATATAQ